ncbi:MAG: hypothetical protein BWY28_02452 [bacterium ADurb.Bin236]|nr:MAG: hypothetical protein BWY28_02452 [bacterium ADurb.Bin236]
MKPKCLDCSNLSRWEQASGGTVPRCARLEAVEEMIRSEMRFWNINGNWSSTWESDESPYCSLEEEPQYICEEEGREVEVAIQEWLDSRLIITERTGPVYRSIKSIENDILWKFSFCTQYSPNNDAESWDDPIFHSHYDYPEIPDSDIDSAEPLFSSPLVKEIEQMVEKIPIGPH